MRLSDTQRLITGKVAPLGDFGRLLRKTHVDGPLLGGILLICGFGLVVLYSAVGESTRLLMNQVIRLGVAVVAMLIVAQMSPDFLRRWTPWGYLAGLVLLVLVLTTGEVGQGARRWLDLGIRFQPSEIMKLAVPMMAAWYLHDRQIPPKAGQLLILAVIIIVPTVLIARQPDLGTSLLIAASGIIVIILAGLSIRLMLGLAVLSVPGALVLQVGTCALKAKVSDRLENTGAFRQLSFEVVTPTNAMRPFETTVNPSQKWSLVFSRDLYTISISGDTVIDVSHSQVANGMADFYEDMILFGLSSQSPIAVPGTSMNSNKFMRLELYDAIKDELHNTIFSSVNIEFTETHLGSLPSNAPQVPYDSFTHSLIAIGGVSDIGALGVAFIDRGNASQDNDVLYNGSFPYNPGLHLGVFLTEIFMAEVNGWVSGLFRLTFDHFIPGRGVPVGEDPDDPAILSEIAGTGLPVSGDAALRRDRLLEAIDVLARYIAVVAGHEMGHSMGLSVNGAMPNGLHGGDPANFPGSTSYHISLTAFPDLFLFPDVNIMIPATSFTNTNAPGTRFNYLNRAYLREKIFYYP